MKYIIYRLFNSNYEECYIGSTTNYKRRIIGHRTNCNNINRKEYNCKVYKFIRENDGFNEWQFEILEQLECNKKDAHITEGIFIEMYNSTLNSLITGRTKKEYRELNKDKTKQNYIANRDKRREWHKQYRISNKDKINELKTTKINCICGSTISQNNKARHEKTIKHIKSLN